MSKKKETKKVIEMNVEQPCIAQPSKKDMREAVNRALQEAELRFQCLDVAKGYAKNMKDLLEMSDDVYAYVFHIKKDKED
jgi:hypothetical protein